jgi:hypothetical protein
MVRPDPRNSKSFSQYRDLINGRRVSPPFQIKSQSEYNRQDRKSPNLQVEVILIRGARLTLPTIMRFKRSMNILYPNAKLIVDKGSNDVLGKQLEIAGIYGTNDQTNIRNSVDNCIKNCIRAERLNNDPYFQQGD